MLRIVLIKPDDVSRGSVFRFSDQIINELRAENEISVVAFGNAISLACMAVQASSSIANIYVNDVTLDYLGPPSLGLGGIFFVLSKKATTNWEKEKKKIEEKMKLNFGWDGQLVIVTQRLSSDEIIPLCLSKLARIESLKIAATGTSINRAAAVAIELTKGNIAKEIFGIKLIVLSTKQSEMESKVVNETILEIYLEKGLKTPYSDGYKQVIKLLEQK